MIPESRLATAGGPSLPAAAKPRFQIDSRYVAPILISTILLVAQLSFHVLESYWHTLLAIGTSILTELALGLLLNRKVPHLASAYVSGISCGILVRSTEWWPFAFVAAISILSKYVIRIDGRHIWNPSNLGICALLVVAPQAVATLSIQWGNSIWPMVIVWTLGSVIIWRLKRFHICATYVAAFFAYALLRAALNPLHADTSLFTRFLTEAAPITGPMYQLFIFFMITDPKTTTHTRWGQMTVAFLVATVESLLRFSGSLNGNHFAIHAPYFALFMMGPTANLIEIYQNRRKKRALA